MKNKKLGLGIIIASSALVLGGLVFANAPRAFARSNAAVHDANCEWNHYEAVDPTYASHGSKEFWACCTHPGEFELAEPAVGHITDQGAFSGEFFEALTDADERYIPELEGGNKFARLDIIDWRDAALLTTKAEYTNVLSVTFKIRVIGEFNLWIGAAVNSDHSNWTNVATISNVFDDEWRLATIEIGDSDGYVNFSYNIEAAMAGSIDIDDFTIVTADGIYCESFENNTLMTLDANHARISGEEKLNRFLRENSLESADEQATVHSGSTYVGVTNVTYKMRIPSGCGSWGNVSVANNLGIYTDTSVAWTADGEWHTYSKDFEAATGYVKFGHEQGHFTGPIDIDDVVITYDGGKVAVETFDGASIIVSRLPAKTTIQGTTQGKLLGTVALDASRTIVENREYSPSFTASTGVDETYGAYVQIDNWACNSGQNRCWIGLTKTEPLSLINFKLGGQVGSYFFYMYNPLENNFSMQILIDHHYSNVATVTLTAKSWTKVSYSTGKLGGYDFTEAHQLGFDHTFANNGDAVGSGWKITSMYAEKFVDPSPFGVVALDAQTGYFRDTKGYNAPHTDSHGIDDDYGAYIQIDDWACPAGANQCWLTFSDTARSVSDIEDDLGTTITNYFFYIYNPLAESFTFKIMLKSSSGMNPNMNVACAPGEWTKVTIAYGQADNGSYPALTSASQIGLTQVLGNGVAVGSGWRVTSVYAE